MRTPVFDKGMNLDVSNLWIVIASRTELQIFKKKKSDHHFELIHRIENPEGRLQNREIDTDKPGRNFASYSQSNARHSVSPRVEAHEEVAKRFAKQIGNELRQGRVEDRFQKLLLIAEPHFLGLINKNIDAETEKRIVGQIPKDLVHKTEHELTREVLPELIEEAG